MDPLERDLDPEELEEEEEEFESSSQESSTQTSTLTWINWFTSLPGHDYYCEVHEDFIEDDFNLTGLQAMVPFWKEAMEMVLDVEPEVLCTEEDSSKIPDVSIVESSAELLYGLVHQRFILTKAGLASMVEKYELGHFGSCPRVYCHWTHVLPVGRADMPGIDTVKLYCPNCGDIYTPPSSKYANVDGAFFGTTFGPLFFQTYPELLPAPFASPSDPSKNPNEPSSVTSSPDPPLEGTIHNPNPHGGIKAPLSSIYHPKIYGFKVSERARSGPRMQWLRERPARPEELDMVDNEGRWKTGSRPDVDGEDTLMGEAGPGGRERKTGALFDDEDEELEEDEEEEEEEDGVGAVGVGAQTGGLGLATGGGSVTAVRRTTAGTGGGGDPPGAPGQRSSANQAWR